MIRPEVLTMTDRAKYWQRMLTTWEASGLTQAEFCRRRGLKAVTFAWWKRQLVGSSRGVQLPLVTMVVLSSPRCWQTRLLSALCARLATDPVRESVEKATVAMITAAGGGVTINTGVRGGE